MANGLADHYHLGESKLNHIFNAKDFCTFYDINPKDFQSSQLFAK